MHVHDPSRMFLIPASPPAVVCFNAWISLFVQASVAHHVVASLRARAPTHATEHRDVFHFLLV